MPGLMCPPAFSFSVETKTDFKYDIGSPLSHSQAAILVLVWTLRDRSAIGTLRDVMSAWRQGWLAPANGVDLFSIII